MSSLPPVVSRKQASGVLAQPLKDEYFARHHLHQQRSTSDLSIWFEIHWALDHPYTLLTVDYESIFARAKPSGLLGEPIQEMALPDLLLSLAIHLVKHAVISRSTAMICRASSLPMGC
jgi:hypothetical protein